MAEESATAIPPEVLQRVELLGRLAEMMNRLWVPAVLYAAVELGLPDALRDGPRQGEELARAVGADPDALARLMRALVSLEVFSETADGAFDLAPLGSLLRSDTRDSFRSMAELSGSPQSFRSWGQLLESVRTGQTTAQLLEGLRDSYEHFAAHPEEQAVFDRSMVEFTRQAAGALVLAYDFSGVRKIADLGGGYGALLPPILRAHPGMTGIVLDAPHCRAGAERVFEKTRIADRCEFVSGNLFDGVPPGADLYVLKNVLHGCDDERGLVVLRNCRAAMGEGSRLLVLEIVAPERLGPLDQGIVGSDLNMLLATGGRERTEAEYRKLLAAADLRIERIVPTLARVQVIEVLPVSAGSL